MKVYVVKFYDTYHGDPWVKTLEDVGVYRDEDQAKEVVFNYNQSTSFGEAEYSEEDLQ